MAGRAEFGGCGQEAARRARGRVQQGGFEGRGDQGLEVPAADLGVGVLRVDDLALLGQPDLAVDRARRLRQDGLVARPAATPDGATAAVEQAQHDARRARQRREQRGQLDLGAVELPVAGEEAAVLVAVAVADHHVLLAARARDQRQHAGHGIEVAHDGAGAAQVGDGLEQRHDDQVAARLGVERAAQQAGLLEQQQHFEQVAGVLGVADDAVAQRGRAVALPHGQRGLEDRQLALHQRRVVVPDDAQRPRVVEQALQQRAPGRLGECGVVGLEARGAQQLGNDRRVLVRALTQVERREMEAEDLQRAHQRRQPRRDQRAGVVVVQRGFDDAQVGKAVVGRRIRVLRRDGVAQRAGARERLQRRRQPRVDAGQRAAVGLVLAVRVAVGAARGQRPHRGRDRGQQLRGRELGAELVDLAQVVAQRDLGLARQRQTQRVGVDMRVAVAVAADPVAHAEERRHRRRRLPERAFEVAVEPRQRAQEGRRVVRQRVVDLVGDRQPGKAQHPRLPELRDARAQQGLVVGALGVVAQRLARGDKLGDRALGVEDALALDFGRVGGQHRADLRALQRGADLVGAEPGRGQVLEAARERARGGLPGDLLRGQAARLVAVLGDVGEVAEVRERADHADRLVDRQALEQAVEVAPGARVVLVAVGHREPAHALDELVGRIALLLADDLAEDAPEQPDVVEQRGEFAVGGGGARRARRVGAGHGGGPPGVRGAC